MIGEDVLGIIRSMLQRKYDEYLVELEKLSPYEHSIQNTELYISIFIGAVDDIFDDWYTDSEGDIYARIGETCVIIFIENDVVHIDVLPCVNFMDGKQV